MATTSNPVLEWLKGEWVNGRRQATLLAGDAAQGLGVSVVRAESYLDELVSAGLFSKRTEGKNAQGQGGVTFYDLTKAGRDTVQQRS